MTADTLAKTDDILTKPNSEAKKCTKNNSPKCGA